MDSGWKIGSLKCSGSRWLDKSGAQEKGMGTEGDLGVINGHQSYFWSPGDEFPPGRGCREEDLEQIFGRHHI